MLEPAIAMFALTTAAAAQPEWSPRFGFTGFHGGVHSIATFDADGPGPRPELLCAGGRFTRVGDLDCNGLAVWNGKGWAPVPACPILVSRFLGTEFASGRLLMVGERDNNQHPMHAWDGDTFTQIGTFDQRVLSLDHWDADGDGPGKPLMIVGGEFDSAMGQQARMLASWDGAKWAEFGGGAQGEDYYAAVRSVVSWDADGDGPALPALIIAGDFTQVGDLDIGYLARWDGTEWTSVGGGVDGRVDAAAVFDEDGAGPGKPALFVSGSFTSAGGQQISKLARYDGQTWTKAGSPDGGVFWLKVMDTDGDGPLPARLMATGVFTSIGGQAATHAAAWDGSTWTPLGNNLLADNVQGEQRELAAFDADGAGPETASIFTPRQPTDSAYADSAGGDSIAVLEGDTWREVAGGVSSLFTFPRGVFAMTAFATGEGDAPVLVLAGSMDAKVQTWDGGSLLGAGVSELCCYWDQFPFWGPYVYSATVFDEDGDGPALPHAVIGGWFERINEFKEGGVARWDGASWAPMGNQFNDAWVYTLLAADLDGDGPAPAALLAGGWNLRDQKGENGLIARWDGAAWLAFDAGLERSDDLWATSLALVDPDGDGLPTLYASGTLIPSDDPASPNLARWDGARWRPVGGGLDAMGRALASYDADGDGPGGAVLVVGGDFTIAGGQPRPRIASWDGQDWGDFGGGMDGPVHAIAVHPVGQHQTVLYAGGAYTSAGGKPASNIAEWNGSAWAPLGAGAGGLVRAIQPHDDDGPGPIAPALYIGGEFETAGGLPSSFLARWGDLPAPACPADCDGSASLEIYDWLCFLGRFNTADARADCDGSGGLDLFDFLCFVNAFNAGC
jgi:hypothetical protein